MRSAPLLTLGGESPLRFRGFLGQHARPKRFPPIDRVAMHAWFRHAAFGALEYTRLSAVSRRFAIPTGMDSHADDCAPGEAFQRNALFERFPGAFHLNNPDQRLTLLIANQSIPFFVQRNE